MALHDPVVPSETEISEVQEADPARERLEKIGRFMARFPSTIGRGFRALRGDPVPRFYMGNFYSGGPGSAAGWSDSPASAGSCGTSACVAGHAYLIMHEDLSSCRTWKEVSDRLTPREILAVEEEALYFQAAMFGGEWRSDPLEAADRLAYFLETGDYDTCGYSQRGRELYQSKARGAAGRAGWTFLL